MWPWIKVKVNIINTWYITMSDAVAVPSLMMMTSIVEVRVCVLVCVTAANSNTDGHYIAHIDGNAFMQVKKKCTKSKHISLIFNLLLITEYCVDKMTYADQITHTHTPPSPHTHMHRRTHNYTHIFVKPCHTEWQNTSKWFNYDRSALAGWIILPQSPGN